MSPVRLSFIKGYSLISAHDPEDPTDPIIGAKPVAEGSHNEPSQKKISHRQGFGRHLKRDVRTLGRSHQ